LKLSGSYRSELRICVAANSLLRFCAKYAVKLMSEIENEETFGGPASRVQLNKDSFYLQRK